RMTGAGWQESSTVIAESKADDAGRAEFRFTVPDDLGGAHGLWIDTGSAKRTGTYWITPTALPLDVSRGPVGTTFMIHLKGVGWAETAKIYTVASCTRSICYVSAFHCQS